jgi:hypothetical protein
MTLAANGRLLVNTTTDSGNYIIQGNGNIASINSSAAGLFSISGTRSIGIQSFAGDWNYLRSNGANLVFGTQDANTLYIRTSDVDRLTITSTGTAIFSSIVDAGTFAGNALNYIDGTDVPLSTKKFRAIQSRTNNDNGTVGLDLSNTQPTNGVYSPVISFSAISSGNVYNCTYAAIWGVKTSDEGSWAAGDLIFGTANPYGVTQRVRITAEGNMGIGISVPLQTATNRRVLTVNGTSTAIINLGVGGALGAYWYYGGTSSQLYSVGQLDFNTSNSTPFTFNPNGVEAMRISSGDISFNTTTSNSSNGFTGGVIRNSAISGAIAGMAFMAYDWVQGGIWHGRGATSGKDGALVLGTNPDTSILGVGGLTGRVFIFNNGNVSINNQADSGKKFYVNGNAYITSDLSVGNGINLYGQLAYSNTYSSSAPFEFLKITYGGGAYCGIKMTVYNPINSIDSNLGFSVMNSSGTYTELLLLQGSAQQAYFRAAINTTSSLYVSSTATIAYSGLSGDFGSGYTTGMGVGYSSSIAKGINMGWNTTYDMGFIGTVHNGTAWKSLTLCPIGGAVYIGITGGNSIYAGAFYESSDMRLKQLIEDDYKAVGIESVKTRLYTKEGKLEVGYYAQDFETILPSAVSKNDAGFLSLSYTQVHTAKIAVIEDKVTILEREVAELKSKLQKYEV